MEIAFILQKVGIRFTESRPQKTDVKVSYFNNPDGTVRWFWPAHSNKPLFLKFYNASGLVPVLFSKLIILVFKLRLQRLLFKSSEFEVSHTAESFGLLPMNSDWAVFTGTPGPNRKAIVYADEEGKGSFIKVALGDHAGELLRTECSTLVRLQKASSITFGFPKVIQNKSGYIKMSDVAKSGKRIEKFSSAHVRAILELRNESFAAAKLDCLEVWQLTKNRFENLKQSSDQRLPKGMLRKLDELIAQLNTEFTIETCLSHGDFTPWNMYIQSDGSLSIYDWELSKERMPFGFDAFHFLMQNAILVEHKSWKKIYERITYTLFQPASILGKYSSAQQQLYLKLYLVINTVYYLTIYHEQEKWHVQVDWLINTWNEALSSMLSAERSHRELVIMDTIDFLSNKKYGALKYFHDVPERLSEFSDLDFCIDRSDYQLMADFLAHHSLVKHRQVNKKSNMASEQLVLVDGSMLSLDFIWQLKRTHLEMMNATSMLQNSFMGKHGVKIVHPTDDARFVGLFYSLNNEKIPARYKHYQNELQSSKEYADPLLLDYFKDEKATNQKIRHYLKAQPVNSGFRGIINRISYWMDVVREAVNSRGMVVTFSGVDGAGKSTVIAGMKELIQKQLRKRVIVLRHRPSMLPILSAWTKGKVKAEQEASLKLPRQGNNKNRISSLLRFSYYYADYLFGQWYILFKYVMRGYVVLYDRYYFDFINDSKRSNIELPSFITRLGYSLIREPDLNIFLYANADLILSRKKELDKDTIEALTERYLKLFVKLNQYRSIKRYIPIENIELPQTLQTILGRVSSPLV
jgi:thymidylate kinase/thiamine kinase-like enzyme